MRRLLALPTLVLALAGVGVATATLIDLPVRGSATEGSLAEADRVVVYQLTRASGPRFRLPGGPEDVHLFVHLELPRALTVDEPAGVYRFGVVASLRAAGGELVWERLLTQRTRQTRDEGSGEGWNYEAAVAPDGRLELSDSVSLELHLPPAPVGAVLELRLDEAAGLVAADGVSIERSIVGATALVRAYRRIAVDPAEAEIRRLALASDAGVRRLAAATYLPWYALPVAQQRERLMTAWERLAAEGRAGVDYEVRSIYLAPPRPPVAPPPAEPRMTIGRGQPLALQVVGPGSLELRAWPIGAAGGTVELRLRRISGAVTAEMLAVPGDRSDGPGDGSGGPGDGSGAEVAGGPGDRSGPGGVAVPGDRSGVPGDRSGPGGVAVPGDRSGPGGVAVPGDRSDGPGDRSGGPGDRSDGPGDRSGVPGDRSGAGVAGDRSEVAQERALAAVGGEEAAVLAEAGGEELRRTLVVAGPEPLREALALGAGWWTLELHTEAEAIAVQLRADAPERHAGPDEHGQHRDHAGRAFVPVDLRVLPLYRGGPGVTALPFALRPGGDVDARLLEIEVRALGASVAVPVQYRFVDGEGRALASGAALAETVVPAPFERLRRSGAVSEDRSVEAVPGDRSAGFALSEWAVSEPVRLRVLAPPGTARMEVWSEGPALLAVHGRLPAPTTVVEAGPDYAWPYDQVEDAALRWRYVARAAPRSFPRRADDHAVRSAAGESMLLHAQVRAEARVLVEGEGSRWRAEHPRGGHARLRLLERVPPERRRETLAHWGPGTYMRLRRGSAEAIDLGAGGPRPARAWVQATGSGTTVVGKGMALVLGGQTLRWTISAREGRTPLPGRGSVELRWSEGPDDLLVLVDRPPGGPSGAPLYEHRQLHRLGGGGLALTIDKPDAAPLVVNSVLYWIGGSPEEATALRVEIDGGQPRRREGAQVQGLTPGVREIQVLPDRRVEVVLPDRRGLASAGVARVATILGDDLAPGRHTIRISPVSGPPAWVRFFRAGVADVRGGALQWNERRGAVNLEDSDDEEE